MHTKTPLPGLSLEPHPAVMRHGSFCGHHPPQTMPTTPAWWLLQKRVDERQGSGSRRAAHPQTSSVGKLCCALPGSLSPGCRTDQSITWGDLGLQGCHLPWCLVDNCSLSPHPWELIKELCCHQVGSCCITHQLHWWVWVWGCLPRAGGCSAVC